MRRSLRIAGGVGLGLMALVCALLLALLLLTTTEGGSRLLVHNAVRWLDGGEGLAVSYGSLRGRLLDRVLIEDLRVDIESETGRNQVTLARVELGWDPGALLAGTLRVDELALRGLDVTVRPSGVESPPTDVAALLEQVFNLPLAAELGDLRAEDITLDLDGQQVQVALLAGSAALDRERLTVDGLRLESDLAQAEGALRLGADLGVRGALAWRLPEQEPAVAGALRLGGDLRRLLLEHRLESPALLLSEGEVAPGVLEQSEPSFDLRHRLEGVDPALPGVAALGPLSGTLATRGTPARVSVEGRLEATPEGFAPVALDLALLYADGALAVENLQLSGEQVDLSAAGRLAFGPFAVEADWMLSRLDSGASLPLVLAGLNGAGSVNLTTGNAGLDGDIGLERLAGTINGYPLEAQGAATLQDGALTGFQADLRAEDNVLALTGSLAPDFGVEWELDAPALAVLLPELRGRLAGSGSVSGSPEAPRLAGRLSGGALSYPLEGGRVSLDALDLDLQPEGEEGNRIQLGLDGLRLPLGAEDLRVSTVALALTGLPAAHELELDVDSNQGRIRLRASGGWEADAQLWSGSLDAASIDGPYGDWRLREPAALQAGAESASLAALCWDYASIALCGEGNWQAQSGYDGALSLDALPLAFLNRADTLALLDEPGLRERWAERPEGLAELLEGQGVALPANVFVDGELALEASASGAPGGAPTVELRIDPRALRLGLLLEQESESESLRPTTEIFQLDDAALALSGAGGAWRAQAGFAVLRQRNDAAPAPLGRLDGSAGLAANGALDGELNLAFATLAWLETLVPQISEPRGELRADLRLGGTREAPELLGEVRLRDGGLSVPEYGLALRELDLALRSQGRDSFVLQGFVRSGDGSLRLDSTVRQAFGPGRNLELRLSGSDFLLADRPDLMLVTNPDLRLALSMERADIRGSVAVPRFLLDLEDSDLLANRGGVEVSRDVVVVAAPSTEGGDSTAAEAESLMSIPVTGNVSLTLGEEVNFRGMGLELSLGGDMTVEMEANRPLLAYGEVDILEGSYQAYGQTLQAEGKLIFLGNPANPALDMRAFREVSTTTVGVQMSGTLRNIQGQLYSTPALPESEILAILVTGRSFQNAGEQDSNNMLAAVANFGLERGQGITNTVRSKLGLDTLELGAGEDINESSLGLGKYITPDLFLRYDIGLFDRQSSLSINYSLTERLRLEVATGVGQSVDLTYTVEK